MDALRASNSSLPEPVPAPQQGGCGSTRWRHRAS